MKKTFFAACFFLTGTSLFSIPPSLSDERDGWLDMSVNFTLTIPDFKPNFGLHVYGAGPDHWGIGLSLVIGDSLLEITFNVLHYFEIGGAPAWNVPLYLKLGYINGGLGFALESGVKYFFWEIPAEPPDEYYYVNAELLGGLHVILYSFLGGGALYNSPGFCFKPIPAVALNAAFSLPVH